MVYHLLTKRQGDYLRLRCAGQTDREAAETMGTGYSNVLALGYGIGIRLGGRSVDEICRMVEDGVSPSALFGRPVREIIPMERAGTSEGAKRTVLAMDLRRTGMTYRKIGRLLGISNAGAQRMVRVGVYGWFRRAGVPIPRDKWLDELLAMIPGDDGGDDAGCPDQAVHDLRATEP
jgi:DNA-binding CsgD family transcriptional regulator